jgi:demethylmenaquinone methyltransferase/2-methoxy-6-polyprenyl-1,4-benzoquinol methylase
MSNPTDKPVPDPASTTNFGYREVPVAEKQKLVGDVFTSVARSYDRMNDLMSLGVHRLWKRYFVVAGIEYVQCNAEALPFPDRGFDLVTIAFGLRNVTDKPAALREMKRVLKIGGRALVLEFSQIKADWLKPIYDFHSFQVLPRLGNLFAKDAQSYRYLAESIRMHPGQDALRTMMEEAGFARCEYRNLSGGIVAIHSGYSV